MNKTLCVTVVLIGGALALSFGSASTPNSTPTSPVIVVKRGLVNQTTPIPTTTIFTPVRDGVFRLSVYGTITRVDSSSQSSWVWNPQWTDDGGAANCNGQCYLGPGSQSGPSQLQLGVSPGLVMTIEAKAGTPITYSVYQAGNPDNSAYSLYYALEQIE
jgi:hypothetical protein